MFLLTILKDVLNLHYKKRCEAGLRTFSPLNLQWLQHDIYINFGGIRDLLKQNLALQFCRKRNKDFSILTETNINLDQVHYIRNNWLGVIFFYPGDSHTKGLLVLFNVGLEGVSEVDTDPKGRFVSFKFNPSNDIVLCVYAPLRASHQGPRG